MSPSPYSINLFPFWYTSLLPWSCQPRSPLEFQENFIFPFSKVILFNQSIFLQLLFIAISIEHYTVYSIPYQSAWNWHIILRRYICEPCSEIKYYNIAIIASSCRTVHDTLKWTVPLECHSRQNPREMPRMEHLACHSIINHGSSIPMPLEPSSINRAQYVSRILRGRLVDHEMSVPRFLRDSHEGLTFFVQFLVSYTVYYTNIDSFFYSGITTMP